MAESQDCTMLQDKFFDDPSQLSQLLRQRAGSQLAIHSFDPTSQHIVNTTPTFPSERLPSPQRAAAAPSLSLSPTRAAARRVRYDSQHATPNLHKHHSAPVSTGELMTEREDTRKPYQSFNVAMDAPGDTQADPEIYKMLTSGIYGSNGIPGAVFDPVVPVADEGSSESAGNYATVSSQEQPRDCLPSPVTINDDQDAQLRAHYAGTSPLKLIETPIAYPNRKRDSQGQVLSSVARTNTSPGTVLSASVFFGFGSTEEDNNMSLTQAFNATQAKTSPAVGNPNDDVVFQRPSPNFAHARYSSADAMMSSPIKQHSRKGPVSDVIMRSSSEARTDYESMKHSQERRHLEHAGEDVDFEEQQDSWEQPTGIEKHYIRQKAKERFEQDAAKSLAGVSAPTSSERRPKKRGLSSMRATTTSPDKPTGTNRTHHYGPYDGAGADAPYELSQPLPRNEGTGLSPDELSRDLFNRRSAPATVKIMAGVEQRVQVPHTSSHPAHTFSEVPSRNPSPLDPSSSQPQTESQIRPITSQPAPKNLSRLRSSRETEVVMDSQPDPAGSFSASQPAPLRFPSSPSTNQYSINQTTMLPKSALISSPISSAVPMPPKFSSQELVITTGNGDTVDGAEEGVPSSPPLIVQDDDITYDEHAYEEDSDVEPRERDAQTGEHDVNMAEADDEDGLPTPRNEPSKYAEPTYEDEAEDEERAESMRNDDEVPETIEEQHEKDVLIRSTHPEDVQEESANESMGPPRINREPTVPETDVLEDTQLSLFPEAADDTQLDSAKGVTEGAPAGIWDDQDGHVDHTQNQANSNEHFNAVKEHQSTSQIVNEVNSTIEESVAAPSPARFEGRLLLDIADEPATQQSVDLEAFELPQLSFEEDPDDPLDAMIARDSPYHPQKKRRTTYSTKKAFRSPIKETDPASDQLSSPPHRSTPHATGWSPPTTQDREAQGAMAAARARVETGITQSATLKSKTRFKPNQPQTPRKGALKTVNKALLSKSPGRTPLKATLQGQTANETTPTKSTQTRNTDIEMRDVDDLDAEDESVQDANIPSIEHTDATTRDDFVEDPSGEPDVPDRVFAFWPGIGYCPATCVGRVDSHRLHVRFDDGTHHDLESMQIRALDLHPADHIKIDVPGMKKLAYVVIGFKDKINPENCTMEYPATTRHGYATVVLEEKQRDILPTDVQPRAKKHIDVPVANIYLTTQLWARLKDRTFKYKPAASPAASASRAGTPRVVGSAIPVSTVLRRSTAGPSLLRDSTARASSVASSTRSSGNVFLNMAFAVTSTSKEVNKDDISKLLKSSGGLVVEEGFHQLFDTDSYNAPMSSAGSANAPSASMHGLKLKRKNEDLRFVALIAQSHSRSPKFLQALSLNIPCLHLRWVHDSLAAGHALPFAKYLLPAGTSTFLDPVGVVRSRNMRTYDPNAGDVAFTQMVKDRQLIFRDESVLIVSEENEQEPYIFLTHAMGATEVGLCSDLEEAKESVDTGAWDWVYVDGKPDVLADAAAQIFGSWAGKTPRKKATKKRKRDGETVKAEPQTLVRTGFVGEKMVKVACGEFVIQSLILGALIE
ncbi:hypothetical protein P171DRAFT_461323 [Karstenula rhodostoma CBS 690.94]|uniref:BRCT domain-containing protein n=1 Tax=Karstenula rhodostoma CBS 690.94 TaxID=1392251 RepID=A0A9P4PNQ6_9PLEO|nr:hypothetical protein P171DRAFT_461323 [Karstenula rhodostoma CBS 690.94]